MLAQGNALGPGIDRMFGALKGRRPPPSFQGGQYCLGRETRGVAPSWHPPRRWRDTIAGFQEAKSPDTHLCDGFKLLKGGPRHTNSNLWDKFLSFRAKRGIFVAFKPNNTGRQDRDSLLTP
jgi:hypothetical protein